MLQPEIRQNLRHNFTVNILDAAFFGLALGFASFVTVIPLFVNTLTHSAVIIGLVTAIHGIGWQLPQLLTSNRVAQLRRYKPMVVFLTIHERWPFLGLAVVAALVGSLGKPLALLFTLILLAWMSLGGGMTATAWQSMIGKIMPESRRGTFFGLQSAAANLLSSGGAVLAGILLDRLPAPWNFAICFLIAGVSMGISFTFLAQTREPAHELEAETVGKRRTLRDYAALVRADANFRWFLLARSLAQVAAMAVNFYTIYAVRRFQMSAEVAGVMTGVLLFAQTVANPILGWAGDRFGHRLVYAFGVLLAALSAALAIIAPDVSWFYLIFALSGVTAVVLWTTSMSLTLDFGTESERPAYIGLANTLTAPVSLAVALIGGFLADNVGGQSRVLTSLYETNNHLRLLVAPLSQPGLVDTSGFQAAFLISVIAGLMTALILWFNMRDPRRTRQALKLQLASA
jgi:MFS family permease